MHQENIDVIYAILINSVVKTFVPSPCENPELDLREDLPENMTNYILNELECILSIVNQYIGCNLTIEKNILNPGEEIFEKTSSSQDVLLDFGVTQEEY